MNERCLHIYYRYTVESNATWVGHGNATLFFTGPLNGEGLNGLKERIRRRIERNLGDKVSQIFIVTWNFMEEE